MLEVLWRLPEQCAEAWEIGQRLSSLPAGNFAQVVVTGLGGSAIGGDLLRVYAADRAQIPVIVNRDYRMPAFVGEQTLVFATSYSGNTEETLSAYDEARARGAKIIVLTTGGKLKEKAERDGVPVMVIPGGISPRAATGYLFIPTVAVMQRLGLLPDATAEITELVQILTVQRESLGPDQPTAGNLAKQLARLFYGRIPVIYGSAGNTETVAMRWKGQINENSKAMAYFNVMPELNHNEIVGTERPQPLLAQVELVYLRDPADHPRVQARYGITTELIGERVGRITEVYAQGDSTLARMYSLIYVGDYTSVYLALLYGIDPSPVKLIDALKRKLAEVR
ncbi:MAG: bifunctional phosphoglucose/phosphomannose isomerase [Firmicutes bacterium]|nr:bifunctional phosphoglucose/phosphomannose isomerase [Bacillota bacterium]